MDKPAHFTVKAALAVPLPGRLGVLVFYDKVQDRRSLQPLPYELRRKSLRRSS